MGEFLTCLGDISNPNMSVCRAECIGEFIMFHNECSNAYAVASKMDLVYSQLKKWWLTDSLSFWQRRQAVWVLISQIWSSAKVVRNPHLILHSIMENLVGIWDQMSLANGSL